MMREDKRYLAPNDFLHEGNSGVIETRKQFCLAENHLDLVFLGVRGGRGDDAVVDRLQIDDLRRVHGACAAFATQTHFAEGTRPQGSFQCVLLFDPVESVCYDTEQRTLLGDEGIRYPKRNRWVLKDEGMQASRRFAARWKHKTDVISLEMNRNNR